MKQKAIFIGFIFSVLLAYKGYPQQGAFPALKGPYLGQTPPGMSPEVFAPGIVSTDARELHGVFSPDGKEFFFTRRDNSKGSGNRLMYMKEEGGIWTEPELAPFAEDCIELLLRISPDGKKAFFLSERAHPVTGKIMKNDEKIWYSNKTESGWGKAQFLEGPINEGWILSVAAAKDGALYLSGEFENKGGIFRAKPVNDQYRNIEFLFKGSHPYISPDESYIVFDVFDKNGNVALYASFRNQQGYWKEGVKLGPEINATKTEAFGEVSPDGKFLFFHREGDIYWVEAKIIEDLRLKELK